MPHSGEAASADLVDDRHDHEGRPTARPPASPRGLPTPPASPQGRHPDPYEEGSRGLFLVAALTARGDWYLIQKPAGKVVWCELSVGSGT